MEVLVGLNKKPVLLINWGRPSGLSCCVYIVYTVYVNDQESMPEPRFMYGKY